MRNLLGIFLILVLFSCQDDNQAEPQLTENTFSAQRNEVNWSGQSEINLDNETDTLTLISIANIPNDEVLVMKIKFQGVGQYTLTKNQAFYYSTVGRDVIVNKYKLAPNPVGQLEITKYDSGKKLIEGNFTLTLKKEWSYSENNIETLTLSGGRIKGVIKP